MYFEFIIIYVLLVVNLALLVTILAMLLKGKKTDNASAQYAKSFAQNTIPQNQAQIVNQAVPPVAPVENTSYVFCTKCACKYSATEKFCPNCGNPRA